MLKKWVIVPVCLFVCFPMYVIIFSLQRISKEGEGNTVQLIL